VGKGKKEGRERGKRRNKGGKAERKKGSGKGILAIPILVCLRRRCMCQGLVEVNSENGVREKERIRATHNGLPYVYAWFP